MTQTRVLCKCETALYHCENYNHRCEMLQETQIPEQNVRVSAMYDNELAFRFGLTLTSDHNAGAMGCNPLPVAPRQLLAEVSI